MVEGKHAPTTPTPQLPYLVRFLGLHMLMGAAIGVAFVSLLLLTNIGGLKNLIASAQEPYLPLFLLYFFNALTFSSVTMGIAIMAVPRGER